VIESGVHEKQDLSGAFYHEHRRREFGKKSGAFPSSKNGIWDWRRCKFEGLTCTLQFLLSRSSITFLILPHPSSHPTLTISVQIWTNCETYFSEKKVRSPSDPSSWLPVKLPIVQCTEGEGQLSVMVRAYFNPLLESEPYEQKTKMYHD